MLLFYNIFNLSSLTAVFQDCRLHSLRSLYWLSIHTGVTKHQIQTQHRYVLKTFYYIHQYTLQNTIKILLLCSDCKCWKNLYFLITKFKYIHFITICNLLHVLQINKQSTCTSCLVWTMWTDQKICLIFFLVHEYLSAEYKIWNCNGNVLNSSAPVALLKHPTD